MLLGNAQILGDRAAQEDYFATFQIGPATAAIVADGMGGHVAGGIASELAVKAFKATLEIEAGRLGAETPAVLERAVAAANLAIHDCIARHPQYEGMGTTLVALVLSGTRLFYVSVGDSPLYRLRGQRIERLNANHAFVEFLRGAVDKGQLTAEEAAEHPERHALFSALCGAPVELIDLPPTPIEVQPGDQFLLATDGIHSLDDAQIATIVSAAPNARRAAAALGEAVEALGQARQDNMTVVTLFVPEERVTQPIGRRRAGGES